MAHGGHDSDAEIQLAAALQGIPPEQAALMRRAQRSQGLLGTPMPQGQQVGRVYRASSPLEHLAAAFSRFQGGREAQAVDRGFGDLSTRAGQAAQAQAKIQRADKERDFGLREQQWRDEREKERAEAGHRRATLDETERANRARENAARAALEQDAWKTVPDPMGSGFIQWNSKTGEYRTIAPGSRPAGSGPLTGPLPGIPGKPTEDQRKKVLGASESIAQLDMAISALDKAPGAYGGVGNFVAGLAESVGGTPAQSITARRYNPEELRVKNYVSNVVSKIINERAGANVTLREELRQKFLPQDTDGLDQAKQKLGDLRAMMAATYDAQGSGLVPPSAPAPGATTKTVNGKNYEKRADGWYEVP